MIKKTIIAITLLITFQSYSQKTNTSPYSFFGIGSKSNASTVEQLSMGGVGVTLNSDYHLNFSNPASFANLTFTTYTLGIENKNNNAKQGDFKQKSSATYLSYLAVGIPLGTKGGFAFGLIPNSTIGYSLISNEYDSSNTIISATQYQGTGGTNKVFLGFGYKITKGLSVGLQGNFIFGNIDNSIINQEASSSLAAKYQTVSNINSFMFNSGIIYNREVKKGVNLKLGANFELANNLKAKGNNYLYSETLGISRDTVLNVTTTGFVKTPLKSTLGAGLGSKNKWFASVNYSFQNALSEQGDVFPNFSKISYGNYNKISLGGFYTPKYNSITSYWDRVTYRAGLKYEKTGLLVDPSGTGNFNSINDFGISFGIGLPIGNQLSNLNLGFELGKRGKLTNDLIQEKYINFRVSFSLNDKWFNKIEIF